MEASNALEFIGWIGSLVVSGIDSAMGAVGPVLKRAGGGEGRAVLELLGGTVATYAGVRWIALPLAWRLVTRRIVAPVVRFTLRALRASVAGLVSAGADLGRLAWRGLSALADECTRVGPRKAAAFPFATGGRVPCRAFGMRGDGLPEATAVDVYPHGPMPDAARRAKAAASPAAKSGLPAFLEAAFARVQSQVADLDRRAMAQLSDFRARLEPCGDVPEEIADAVRESVDENTLDVAALKARFEAHEGLTRDVLKRLADLEHRPPQVVMFHPGRVGAFDVRADQSGVQMQPCANRDNTGASQPA